MDCRAFRKSHVAFVDGLMTNRDAAEMYEHLQECARCGRLDVVVRRGLLVARNLPPIHPSRDFMPRLEARLRERRPALPPAAWTDQAGWSARTRRTASVATGIAVAVAVFGLLVTRVARGNALPATRPAAAVAGRSLGQSPAAALVPAVSPEFMASLASGIPVWPGISVGDRAAAHLAQVELQTASLSP